MDDAVYADIISYKQHGNLPASFSSTKSNFLALSRKYKLKGSGAYLERNNKPVVKESQQCNFFILKINCLFKGGNRITEQKWL